MAAPPSNESSSILRRGPPTHFIASEAGLDTQLPAEPFSDVFWKRSAHEILPNLWLGGVTAAQDVPQLGNHKIALVLSIRVEGADRRAHISYRFNKIEHVVYAVEDERRADLRSVFAETGTLIAEALRKGEGVLVHCAMGKSRSVAVVMAYLMQVNAFDTAAALELVKEKRRVAEPNAWFLTQLDEWNAELKAGRERVGQGPQSLIQENLVKVEAWASHAPKQMEASLGSAGSITAPASSYSGALPLRNFSSSYSRSAKRRKLVGDYLLRLDTDKAVADGERAT